MSHGEKLWLWSSTLTKGLWTQEERSSARRWFRVSVNDSRGLRRVSHSGNIKREKISFTSADGSRAFVGPFGASLFPGPGDLNCYNCV